MGSVDKRGILKEEIFSYRITKDGRIFIAWQGREVTLISGKNGEKLAARLNGARDSHEEQLILAKATGNFKRGNERR